jgi:hypothetical protein
MLRRNIVLSPHRIISAYGVQLTIDSEHRLLGVLEAFLSHKADVLCNACLHASNFPALKLYQHFGHGLLADVSSFASYLPLTRPRLHAKPHVRLPQPCR